MQSPFIYLHNNKQTIPQDSDRYNRANTTLYRKESFKFIYMLLLCKLYDMSNLPMARNYRAYIYTGVVMTLASVSFFRESMGLTSMLVELDEKYEAAYQKYIKEKNYEGIV